jgi:D-alanine-D-alanine ligase
VKVKNIAIAAYGYSSECEVSMLSAKGVLSFIDKEKYNAYIVVIQRDRWYVSINDTEEYEIDKNDFSFQSNGQKVKFDFVYNIIHGTPGEDGRLQGYLDMLGISYSSCGVLASALTFNKYFNNTYLKSLDIRVSDSIRLLKGQETDVEQIIGQLGLPVFVKPCDSGSSFGVTKVKDKHQMEQALETVFAESNEVLIESFVEGTEVTCGCYKTKLKEVVFPVTEVVTENEFFDYDAKYNGQVQEITPARISNELTNKIQKLTLKIYDLISAKGLIRIDYIIPADNNPVLLEVNTNPGMTPTSFIPQQIKAARLDIKDVMTDIVENI